MASRGGPESAESNMEISPEMRELACQLITERHAEEMIVLPEKDVEHADDL